nr:hypothetical protein [Caulobacter sp. S6]
MAGFDRIPERFVDDAKLRHFLDDPFLAWVQPALALAGVGILDEMLPVPDQPADVELVVQHAIAPADVAVEGGEAPLAAAGGGDVVPVQFGRDALGRFTGGVVAENPAHHLGLGRVDGAVTADRFAVGANALDHVITVGVAAAGLALLDPAPEAAAGLVGEVLQEDRVHRPLQPHMQWGDLALGQGDDLHTSERHALVEAGDVFLVAGEAVHSLG